MGKLRRRRERTFARAKSRVESISREGTIYIQLVAGLLAAIFTWLQLSEVPFGVVITNVQHQYVQQLAIVLYYLCWLGGSTFDVSIQRRVYVHAPLETSSRTASVLLVVLFCFVTVMLLWVKDDFQQFAIALTIFVLVNILGWRHIVGRVRPIIRASQAEYEKSNDYAGLERLNSVVSYISGRWQVRRFAVMLAMLFVINLIAFVSAVPRALGDALSAVFLSVSSEVFAQLLPSVSFAIFVVVAEMWVWQRRFTVWMNVNALDSLDEKYEFIPRK
jgi:hypothetical protein